MLAELTMVVPACLPQECPDCGDGEGPYPALRFIDVHVGEHPLVSELTLSSGTLHLYMDGHDEEMPPEELLAECVGRIERLCPELIFERAVASLGTLTYLCGECCFMARHTVAEVLYSWPPTHRTETHKVEEKEEEASIR
jgi:hypothetical protein